MTNTTVHQAVLTAEVLTFLAPQRGGLFVDCTVGLGGHARVLLEHGASRVIGLDRDREALNQAHTVLSAWAEHVELHHANYKDVDAVLNASQISSVDGVLADLGVSSLHLDGEGRGFSFRRDEPLDMRMDQSGEGQTAADVVNTYDETDIANIIYKYGEERKSRHVARAIVSRRAERLFERTSDLADVVRGAIFSSPKDKIDPATRTFQGLRIYVNKELEELEKALDASVDILSPGGRLVVVSFHSLEDRIVKHFLLDRSGQRSRGSRHMPDLTPDEPAVFSLPSKKAVFPSDDEVADNARSRSARLRYAIRTEAAI